MPKERRSPIQHNSFFTRNERVEHLSSTFGMSQGTDMDMYDYDFDNEGQIKTIHVKKDID